MEVASENWRESSIHGIKLAQNIIQRSNQCVDDSRVTDPLPLLRDVCVKQSNDRIRTYMRGTRAVVTKLRRSFVAVNDEMKSANRCKESLEKALEHNRKDLALNLDSQDIRTCRPGREKELDCAERLLKSEESHLFSLKRSLEAQLQKVKLQLQELASARARLAAAIQERSRVTDLLCQSMSGANYGSGITSILKSSSSLMSPRKLPIAAHHHPHQEKEEEVIQTARSSTKSHHKAYSAPVPLELDSKCIDCAPGIEHCASVVELNPNQYSAGPYDALSVETIQSMNLASEVILKSRSIRQEAATVMDHTLRLQRAAHESVNEGLSRKIAQTVTLTEHLGFNSGETKLALQRSQRQFNAQEKALGYMLGPISLEDLTTREQLDRPIVKVYQRHVGTDLPEAAHLIKAAEEYRDSMDITMKNMALLRLSNKALKEDIKDKKMAAFLDSRVVRLRRRKVDHRWVLQGKACHPKPKQRKETRSLSN